MGEKHFKAVSQLKACKENIIRNSNRNNGISVTTLGSTFQTQPKLVLKSDLKFDHVSLCKIIYASKNHYSINC
jgi:hypothetical protein